MYRSDNIETIPDIDFIIRILSDDKRIYPANNDSNMDKFIKDCVTDWKQVNIVHSKANVLTENTSYISIGKISMLYDIVYKGGKNIPDSIYQKLLPINIRDNPYYKFITKLVEYVLDGKNISRKNELLSLINKKIWKNVCREYLYSKTRNTVVDANNSLSNNDTDDLLTPEILKDIRNVTIKLVIINM